MEYQMKQFTAQQTAVRLGISKQWLLQQTRAGHVRPAPVKLDGTGAPWLFSGNAKIVVDKRKAV
jgi:hypothetical protein